MLNNTDTAHLYNFRVNKHTGVKLLKKPSQTTVRLRLILFSKITRTFLFRIFGGFLHVPTTQNYTGAIISDTRITNTVYI